MDIDSIRRRLGWFHALELNQVRLYKAQASMAKDEADKRMFLKISDIEAGHVENMARTLSSFGGTPSLLSKVAPVSGVVMGSITGASLVQALKSDIALENKAMRDYRRFIDECEIESLKEVLWGNYLDESLHTEWFKSRLSRDVDVLT